MSTNTTQNGHKANVGTTLPATITVGINGGKVTLTGKPSKADNLWYEGRQRATLKDGVDVREALLAAVITDHEGQPMKTANGNTASDGSRVLTASSPKKYRRGTAQAGQNIPGTGNEPQISFVTMLPTWGDHGYMLRVTLTGVEQGAKRFVKVVIACQTAIQGGQVRTVGEVEGDLTFG